MMDLAGLMNTAGRKCLWFKDTLGKLNKERWHRGGEHERKLHNQLSHKLGENILALLARYTECRHLTIKHKLKSAVDGKNTTVLLLQLPNK